MMMDLALIVAGFAMGIAAAPHCAAMCGAPCAALTQGCQRSTMGLHIGRLLGYMVAGAVAASSVAALGAWSTAAPALRPVWTLLHVVFFALGVWWMVTGRMPDAIARVGVVPAQMINATGRPLRSGLIGLAWVAWPCGALQGAIVLSALANRPWGGALVMAAFALGSMPALVAVPWLWRRWREGDTSDAPTAVQVVRRGYRIAGLCLVLSSVWALGHGLWAPLLAWCGL